MNGKTKKTQLVCIDTNIFIYHYQNNPQFVPETSIFFTKLANQEIKAVTSIVTLIELLSLSANNEEIKEIQDAFQTTPSLTVVDIKLEIALEASRIRRTYGFFLPDSIQLATALCEKANYFITNDQKLKRFKEVHTVLLEEFIKSK